MTIYTIGFTKKSLREFISKLQAAGVRRLIDVRLNNTSQLAGYAKKEDLAFVLSLVGIQYEHRENLAPTEVILKDYKGKRINWAEYEEQFVQLLSNRQPTLDINDTTICLLCSEEKPDYCHRRLVAEYFGNMDSTIEIRHL